MRISDWSSDVCSSDLDPDGDEGREDLQRFEEVRRIETIAVMPLISGICSCLCSWRSSIGREQVENSADFCPRALATADRKSVVWGKSVSVRVDIGGRRISKK